MNCERIHIPGCFSIGVCCIAAVVIAAILGASKVYEYWTDNHRCAPLLAEVICDHTDGSAPPSCPRPHFEMPTVGTCGTNEDGHAWVEAVSTTGGQIFRCSKCFLVIGLALPSEPQVPPRRVDVPEIQDEPEYIDPAPEHEPAPVDDADAE